MQEHLGRRLGVGKRAVAGSGRDAEEVGQRGEADATEPSLEQPARERGRAERRLRQAPAVHPQQLLLEEALVEAGVVGDEERVAGEVEEAIDHARDGRRLPQLRLAQAGEAGDRRRERDSRVDEGLEGVDGLERAHANGADLADAVARGREPGRLEVEDDELGLVQQRVGSRSGERDGGAGAGDPAVAGGEVGQERAGEAVRDRGRGEERAGRLGRPRAIRAPRACPPAGPARRVRAAPLT